MPRTCVIAGTDCACAAVRHIQRAGESRKALDCQLYSISTSLMCCCEAHTEGRRKPQGVGLPAIFNQHLSLAALQGTAEPAYLQHGGHGLRVRRCEAHMKGGRQLQRAEVPALGAQRVIELVDVEAAARGPERDHAHLGLTHHLQAWDGVDALPQLVCCLRVQGLSEA